MPRQTTPLELALPPRPAGASAARWLYDALRGAILDGRLRPGARLPASRDLASHHALSRGTIVAAFEQLKAEGYLEGRTGSGTYVASVLPDSLLAVAGPPPRRFAAERRLPRHLSGYGRRVQDFGNHLPGPVRAFRANQPALDLFPTTLWAQIAARRLRRASAGLLLSCPPLGYRPLQEQVAQYLTAARGVRCTADQVAIVSGVQEALDLVARLTLDPGDRAGIENPGYLGARLVFEALGAAIVPLPLDEQGVTVPGRDQDGVRLIYVTPAHQFPAGTAMTLARRLALLDWARHSGALIFEDDYDSEFRYAGRPMPALQGLDRHGQVLFAGSFSKVLFPSLRLGYLVLPDDLLGPFADAQSITHRHASLLEQAVLTDFIAAGHFGRHVRRMREVYAERLAVLLDSARRHLAGLLDVSPVEAGLQTAAWLTCGLDGATATAAAARRNVEVLPLGRYGWHGAAIHGLQLGFAAVDPREIRRGARDLAAALEDEVRAARREV